MDWTTIALIALGVVGFIAVLWFVVAVLFVGSFRRLKRDFDEDWEKTRERRRDRFDRR